MFLPVLLLLFQPGIGDLDSWARTRDVERLDRTLSRREGPSPFAVVRTGGAYGVGERGWRAVEGKSPSGEYYVVFTTPLTVEDVGELVFRRVEGGLVFVPETDGLGVKVVRHDFDVRFRPEAKRAEIVDRLELQSAAPQGRTFLFRMAPPFQVAAIDDEAGKPVPFTQVSGVVLAGAPKPGQATWTVRYAGVVDLAGYAGTVGKAEASLADDYWYPMIARGPAPYSVAVRHPSTWLAVGQGVQTGRAELSDEAETRFRMDLPVTFYSLSAGPYLAYSDIKDGWTSSVWGLGLSRRDAEIQAKLQTKVAWFYRRLWGWPFQGFGALLSPGYGGGALEAYSYATYGGGLPYEDGHEPAHTIFGGVLGNDYLHSFWNESFATYADGLFDREVDPSVRDERRLAFIRTADPDPSYLTASCAESGAAIGPAAASLGYGKGALVLQMLEQMIGTEAMIAAVQRWIADQPAGALTGWEDFERAAIATSPQKPVKAFFDAWIRGVGYPRVSYRNEIAGNRVRLRVEASRKGYLFPLDVMLVGPKGEREFREALVDARNGAAEVSIESPWRAAKVVADPWARLLAAGRPPRPAPLAERLGRMPTFAESRTPDSLARLGGKKLAALPKDLRGTFVVGHPDRTPRLGALCGKAGFQVVGDELSYRGTKIDLRSGGAIAEVELAGGGTCVIGIGTTEVAPKIGRAKLALFDGLGRFLRGVTVPPG